MVILLVALISILVFERWQKHRFKDKNFWLIILPFCLIATAEIFILSFGALNFALTFALLLLPVILCAIAFFIHLFYQKPPYKSVKLPQEGLCFYKNHAIYLVDKCLKITKLKEEINFLTGYKKLLLVDFQDGFYFDLNEKNEYLLYLTAKYGVR